MTEPTGSGLNSPVPESPHDSVPPELRDPLTEQPMEIHHAPERPIHSAREFFLALATITIGILIAMSLEGIVTWAHHRALVREAKARLAEEMRDNRREVAGFVDKTPAIKEAHDQVIRFIDDIAAKKPFKGTVDLHSSYDILSLSTTSWDTAQATGALAYMEYADVQKYAAIYNLQAKVRQFQDRLLADYVIAFIPPGMDPDTATPAELRAWKRSIATLWQQVDGQRQLAEDLIKQYDKVLAQR